MVVPRPNNTNKVPPQGWGGGWGGGGEGVGRWGGFQGLAETAELRLKRKPNKSREQPSFSLLGPGVLTIMLQVSVAGRDVVLFSFCRCQP